MSEEEIIRRLGLYSLTYEYDEVGAMPHVITDPAVESDEDEGYETIRFGSYDEVEAFLKGLAWGLEATINGRAESLVSIGWE